MRGMKARIDEMTLRIDEMSQRIDQMRGRIDGMMVRISVYWVTGRLAWPFHSFRTHSHPLNEMPFMQRNDHETAVSL
jgi:hypothetical protein